ncbi:19328_t:CDS:2, partial [Cetraspora pellucida]
TIRLPFGRAVERYLYSLPISHSIRYKVQSRKRVNDMIKRGLITVEHVEGSIDYLGWKTKKGQCKSTNCLDDVLRLTENGKHRVQQIRANEGNDLQVWQWVWFCSGEGGCQRSCGGIGKCVETCNHYANEHNSKNPLDMHKYSVRVITELMLSEVDTDFPVHMIIKGNHVLQNIIQEKTVLSRINLSREQKGVVLYYQQPDTNAPENSSERYYQLTLIVEDNARYGTSIAFGVSNKENNYTIRLAYHYEELSNDKGFMRFRNCAPIWQLFAMIDKHRPTKWGLQPIL